MYQRLWPYRDPPLYVGKQISFSAFILLQELENIPGRLSSFFLRLYWLRGRTSQIFYKKPSRSFASGRGDQGGGNSPKFDSSVSIPW